MKTYRIGVFEEQGGYMTVKAKSKREAEARVYNYLLDYGLACDTQGKDVEITHREVHLI